MKLEHLDYSGDSPMSVVKDFLKALAGICETKPLGQSYWQLEGKRVRVRVTDVQELQKSGGAVYLRGKGLDTPILIVRSDDESYHCFSNRCTHMGRRLDPFKGEPAVRCCSVMHSTFDHQGRKLSGPAKKSIPTYSSRMEDDQLVIFI